MPKPKRTAPKPNGKTPSMGPTYNAVVSAYHAAQADAAFAQSPLLRDAAKTLEAVMVALQRGDEPGMKAGAKWARTVSRGSGVEGDTSSASHPQKALVTKLHEIARRRVAIFGTGDVDPAYAVRYDDEDAKQAAFMLTMALQSPPSGFPSLFAAVRKALRDAVDYGTDSELTVKAVLRAAGWSERDAGKAVHGARL